MTKKVLIAGDDELMAELLADLCRLEKLETEVICDTGKAVSTACAMRPDIIILDVNSADQWILPVFDALRGHHATNRVPILVVSVVGNEIDWTKWLSGPEAVYYKPFDFQRLTERIREYVNKV